jgi:hypothetical protein
MGERPQLVRPGDPAPKIAMPAPNSGQMMQQMLQMQAMLQRAQAEIQRLNQECATHATKRQHFIGLLICILRAHFPEGARFPMKDFEKIADLGINSKRIDATDEILVEIMTQEQAIMEQQGLVQGDQEFTVPMKPPYTVKLAVPPDGTLAGVRTVSLLKKGEETPLTFRPGKPKKIREFSCNEAGELTFTTDSAGQKMRAVFVFKVKEQSEEEEEAKPLECGEDWHKRDDAMGIRCPQCGDKRKVLEEVSAV